MKEAVGHKSKQRNFKKRQRGKQVTSALPREVFASLALRVSIFCGGFIAGDDRKSKIRNFKTYASGYYFEKMALSN